MPIFERIARMGHEQVVFCHDPEVGLRAIIGIHDTTLGPSLGGCRMWAYATEEDALIDVLRLSEGMTYKASLAGLALGGGKAVILSGNGERKSEGLFLRFGDFVESLGGRYITAEDVGTTVQDLETVARRTRHASGLTKVRSGSGGSGDPSPVTALGVFAGLQACCAEAFGDPSLKGRTVAVQGVGKVGFPLARHLAEAGAELIVTDASEEKARAAERELKARRVSGEAIFDVECDILAPCALGGVLNDATIPRLRCKVVAGAANNQLLEERHGPMLAGRGILYAPDFCINAGGLINVYQELIGYDAEAARRKALAIGETLAKVFQTARAENTDPFQAALRLARRRIDEARASGKAWKGPAPASATAQR